MQARMCEQHSYATCFVERGGADHSLRELWPRFARRAFLCLMLGSLFSLGFGYAFREADSILTRRSFVLHLKQLWLESFHLGRSRLPCQDEKLLEQSMKQ